MSNTKRRYPSDLGEKRSLDEHLAAWVGNRRQALKCYRFTRRLGRDGGYNSGALWCYDRHADRFLDPDEVVFSNASKRVYKRLLQKRRRQKNKDALRLHMGTAA